MDLFGDFNPPRAVEHPVQAEQDLDALEYLFDVPDAAMLQRLRDEARQIRKDAGERGVVVEGRCTTGGDSMAWLCGFDHMVYHALDNPPFAHRLLDIIHRNETRRLEMLLDLGVVDIVVRRAWYESLRSVNLQIYREFLAPLIRHEADLAHQAGLPYMYICTAGTMGLLPVWKEIGVDIVWGVDPVQGDADLPRLKAEAGEWLSFWGGINSWVTLQRGSDAEIRESVEAAVRALGPGGGLVLMPVDALGADVPPHAVDVLLDAWKTCASYPLAG
jgi:uroporphyrinogen-III decarboxylase